MPLRTLLFAMQNVSLCGFVCMMSCKKRVGMSGMRVMSRGLVMT